MATWSGVLSLAASGSVGAATATTGGGGVGSVSATTGGGATTGAGAATGGGTTSCTTTGLGGSATATGSAGFSLGFSSATGGDGGVATTGFGFSGTLFTTGSSLRSLTVMSSSSRVLRIPSSREPFGNAILSLFCLSFLSWANSTCRALYICSVSLVLGLLLTSKPFSVRNSTSVSLPILNSLAAASSLGVFVCVLILSFLLVRCFLHRRSGICPVRKPTPFSPENGTKAVLYHCLFHRTIFRFIRFTVLH